MFSPTCDADQRKQFFGQIQHIFVESDTPTVITRFSVGAEDQYPLI
jgi:hypothetical protein